MGTANYVSGSLSPRWYHEDPLATLGDVGIYNLKSLAALLGPVREVTAVTATALPERRAGEGGSYAARDPDTWQLQTSDDGFSRPLEIDQGGVVQMQGVALAGGRYHVTVSHGPWMPGTIYRGPSGRLKPKRDRV